MARRKYINGLRRHPSHRKAKSPMLHDSDHLHKHPHPDKLETTLMDSIYTSSKTHDSLVDMGYDPNTRVTTYKDGTKKKVTRGSGGYAVSGAKTTVSKIPDNFQQMGRETKTNTFSRNMLAPEDYL